MKFKESHLLPLLGLFVLLVFHSPFSPLFALDAERSIHQYLLDQWEISDGLPTRNILSIAQTPDGYLWLASTKGLVRFDGVTFSTIQLSVPGVQGNENKKNAPPDTLLVDKQGILWIGSSAGLTRYHYKNGQYKTFTRKDGLAGDRIRRIREDMRGNLWIGLWVSYLNRFTDGKFTHFNASHGLSGKKINAIVEDMNGHLLVGTRENGVFELQQGRFFKCNIKGLGTNHLIITMCEDWKGALWIGTNKGLFRVKSTGKSRVKAIDADIYTTRQGLSNDYIIDIIEDSDRNLWVGTLNGLNRVKNNLSGDIAFEKILENNIITSLFEDKERSLWIGTDDSGLKQLKNGKFIAYTAIEELEKEIILSLFEDRQGDIWIGTLSGKLYQCRRDKYIDSLEIPGIIGTGIAAVAEDGNGNLWLGTFGKGVFLKKKGKNTAFINFTTRDGLADNSILSIFCDSRNITWFSTFDGVSRYSSGVFQSFKNRDGLLGKEVHNVYEDKNHNIRIATQKGITLLKDGQFNKQNRREYLKGLSVTCIYEDRAGVSWIATHGAGLKRFQNGTYVSYTTAHGMTTNFIYQMFEDERENLWMMSDSGILWVRKKELNQFANGSIDEINCASYGISDGMKSIEFHNKVSRSSALKTREGEFWFATKKGITIVNPSRIRINKYPPPVIIQGINFNDQPVRISEKVFKGIKTCEFHFTSPSFLAPEKIKFKYKLDGYDKKWVYLQAGEKRMARYQNLAPGTYTFRVTACNSDGIWNKTGTCLEIRLKSSFLRTPTFIAAVLLVIIVLFVFLYAYVKRCKLQQQLKSKTRISKLSPEEENEYIKKLVYLLEVEQVYKDPNLSIKSLAARLLISARNLSNLINDRLKTNFYDLVCEYRIKEAQRLLKEPKTREKSIIDIAYEVGYHYKSAFNRAFKSFTGMTPSEFRKKQ